MIIQLIPMMVHSNLRIVFIVKKMELDSSSVACNKNMSNVNIVSALFPIEN